MRARVVLAGRRLDRGELRKIARHSRESFSYGRKELLHAQKDGCLSHSLTGTPRSPSRPTENSAGKQKTWGRKGQSCHRIKRGKPVRGPRIATRIIERSTSYESIGDYWRPERFDVLGDPQLRNTESSRSTDDCAFHVLRGPKTCQKETHATVDKRGERSRR